MSIYDSEYGTREWLMGLIDSLGLSDNLGDVADIISIVAGRNNIELEWTDYSWKVKQ